MSGRTPTHLVKIRATFCGGNRRKNWSATHRHARTPRYERLLGFSEPASTGDELDAIECAFAVDVPPVFQLVERTGFLRPLSAIQPLGVVVVDHLPLRVAFHNRNGGRVLIDHMDRPV